MEQASAPLPAGQGEAYVARRIPLPAGTQPLRVQWLYAVTLTGLHLLALLALVPWFFSWTGVALFIFGHFFFGMFGITMGYHRLISHKSFGCPKWFEYTLAIIGSCCGQESPVRWAAIHRMHHQGSDQQPDPHSPMAGFWWGYVGWLFFINRDHWLDENYRRYVKDLLKQPFYAGLERYLLSYWVFQAHLLLFFLAGLAARRWWGGTWMEAVQFGLSLLIWGGILRTVVFLNVTWSVNGLCHWWGYRNYDTRDNSRNNLLVGFLGHGEGWHNNHHAHQRWARHGLKWWEFDLTHLTIRLLGRLGLTWDVVGAKEVVRDPRAIQDDSKKEG